MKKSYYKKEKMNLTNLFKKSKDKTKETEVLYSSYKHYKPIDGVELPKEWGNLNSESLKKKAQNSILELSRSLNSDFKAKELGFENAEHLMKLCFEFILK